ncbi:hypothetical protein PLICRDRAFT_325109 [Plicaturopsis crispa FD-325 SS-3]|nr:hypothetical protein PLICRDRAFT_325109 [Plicaturopsis crispa FD-325 SS-3]
MGSPAPITMCGIAETVLLPCQACLPCMHPHAHRLQRYFIFEHMDSAANEEAYHAHCYINNSHLIISVASDLRDACSARDVAALDTNEPGTRELRPSRR